MKRTILTSLALFTMFIFSDCTRRGCMENVECVENYNPKAEKPGDCEGCMDLAAFNYCPEATRESLTCLYQREFYSSDPTQGWIEVRVADSAETRGGTLILEGRITQFPVNIPDCDLGDSTLTVIRRPGEYYYEIETQTGLRDWGWTIFREEGCRLQNVF